MVDACWQAPFRSSSAACFLRSPVGRCICPARGARGRCVVLDGSSAPPAHTRAWGVAVASELLTRCSPAAAHGRVRPRWRPPGPCTCACSGRAPRVTTRALAPRPVPRRDVWVLEKPWGVHTWPRAPGREFPPAPPPPAFRGDAETHAKALAEIRSHFRKNAHLTDPGEVQQALSSGLEAANFIANVTLLAPLPRVPLASPRCPFGFTTIRPSRVCSTSSRER